jgi:hypothetical protein
VRDPSESKAELADLISRGRPPVRPFVRCLVPLADTVGPKRAPHERSLSTPNESPMQTPWQLQDVYDTVLEREKEIEKEGARPIRHAAAP